MEEDLDTIHLGKPFDDPKGKMHAYKSPLIVTALGEMVKAGQLVTLDADRVICMLTQPLGTFTQNVQISPYTANLIAEAVNFFARHTGSTSYVANKMAINDMDINMVAASCFSLRDQIDEMYEMGMGDDTPEDNDGFPPFGAETPENN